MTSSPSFSSSFSRLSLRRSISTDTRRGERPCEEFAKGEGTRSGRSANTTSRWSSVLLLGFALMMCSLTACGSLLRAVKGESAPAPAPEGDQLAVHRENQSPGPDVVSAGSIAVFPFENLSGTAVPLGSLRTSLTEELTRRGLHLLDEGTLERFMARHRVRYTAGIDEEIARALKQEIGVEGVLLTSLEFYDEGTVPKIALTSRLVSTGDAPAILWVDGVGMAGDDHPGILGLGLINDPHILVRKALGMIGESLTTRLSGQGNGKETEKGERKFRPKIAYRSADLEGERKYTVAIAPFFNKSDRKNAGDVLVLQFVRALHRLGNFEVVEPGLVRKAFLSLRIIMDEGVSLSDAQALFAVLGADLVLAGEVLDYQDYQGFDGTAKVNFTVQLIERKSRMVVWSFESYNRGDDGVFFFDWGKVNTAHAMAIRMAESIGDILVKR